MKTHRFLLPVGITTALVLCCVLLAGYSVSLDGDLNALRSKQREMSRLKDEYLLLNGAVNAVESKRALSKAAGIVQAVDEIFQSIGLKQKVKSIKPVFTRELKDAIEEDAEVLVEKADMNELVNLFYRIESAPMILAVKGLNMKTSFDSPERLNAAISMSYIKMK